MVGVQRPVCDGAHGYLCRLGVLFCLVVLGVLFFMFFSGFGYSGSARGHSGRLGYIECHSMIGDPDLWREFWCVVIGVALVFAGL